MIDTKTIPGFAVETVMEKEKSFKAVINNIQSSSTAFESAITVSA